MPARPTWGQRISLQPTFHLMTDFLLTTIVPILAVFWMVVGGLIFAFMATMAVAVHVFGRPMREAGTDKLADPKQAAKTELIIGGWGLAFAAAGAWLFWSEDQALKGQFLFVACAGGGLIAITVLWSAFRR